MDHPVIATPINPMITRLAPALLLACTACWGSTTYVKGDLTKNDRAAFQPRDTPGIVACVVEDNDIGAKVADALQECGYEVPRILLAADVIPSHSEWANRMRQVRGGLPPLEDILLARKDPRYDWGPWLIGELRDENPVFGKVDWVVTVRLACGRVPVSAENKGPRVAQLDVDAFDMRTSQRIWSYRTRYEVRGWGRAKEWNYGTDATLRDECMAPLVDDFRKQLSEATPKR